MAGGCSRVALLAAKAGRAEINFGHGAQFARFHVRQTKLEKGAFRHAVGLGEDVHRRGNMGGIGLQCAHSCNFKQSRRASRGEDVRNCG